MKTVAALDDDQSLLELYQTVLEEEGYAFRPVGFSRDLERVLGNIRTARPDLLLLDVHLPGLSSFEIMQGIREDVALASLKILICSASRPSLAILREMMEQAGLVMPEILDKPFNLEDLTGSVEKLIGAAE